MSRTFRRARVVAASILSLCLLLTGVEMPAFGLSATSHGVGFMASGPAAWIGSYQLSDGTRAFCLQVGKATPIGTTFDYVDASTLGWFGASESAQLAFISREWADNDDRVTAAAAQLATWRIAGLGGKSAEFYAARAGVWAPEVLRFSEEMLGRAEREASTAVHSSVALSLPENGQSSIRVDLTADTVRDGKQSVAAGRHKGKVSIEGAQFGDGTTSATVMNGVETPITPDGAKQTVTVTVSADFRELPFGNHFTVATPRRDVQNLLVAEKSTASTTASADITGVSPLSFQPTVETRISSQRTEPGTFVTDLLMVDVGEGADVLSEWGVFERDGELLPIAVVVESTLLGPFAAAIGRDSEAPADAPVVCVVETTVAGPGEYRTPDCELPEEGWYVWTEAIDPNRTASDEGGGRVAAWQSDFGVPSEITHTVALPETATPNALVLANTGSTVPSTAVPIALTALSLGAVLLYVSRHARRRRCRRAAR